MYAIGCASERASPFNDKALKMMRLGKAKVRVQRGFPLSC